MVNSRSDVEKMPQNREVRHERNTDMRMKYAFCKLVLNAYVAYVQLDQHGV